MHSDGGKDATQVRAVLFLIIATLFSVACGQSNGAQNPAPTTQAAEPTEAPAARAEPTDVPTEVEAEPTTAPTAVPEPTAAPAGVNTQPPQTGSAGAPEGWQVITFGSTEDPNAKICQISVPSDWRMNPDLPGAAQHPSANITANVAAVDTSIIGVGADWNKQKDFAKSIVGGMENAKVLENTDERFSLNLSNQPGQMYYGMYAPAGKHVCVGGVLGTAGADDDEKAFVKKHTPIVLKISKTVRAAP